jgi:Gamma-glutamyltranspeptidase
MPRSDWRARAGTEFTTEKRSASGSRGMVVTNHPLATAAGAEMLDFGGNAVDAPIAALFTLGVVEPMMVSPLGAGHALLRLGRDRHVVIDSYTTAPAAARPDMYRPVSDHWPHYMETGARGSSARCLIGSELSSSVAGTQRLPGPRVGGGMCAIAWAPDGTLTGAPSWRADGAAIGLGGGHARPGIRA